MALSAAEEAHFLTHGYIARPGAFPDARRALRAGASSRPPRRYGRRQTLREMTSLVDAVTEEDILRIGQFMAASPPSIAAHGEDLSKVPRWATIRDWRLK